MGGGGVEAALEIESNESRVRGPAPKCRTVKWSGKNKSSRSRNTFSPHRGWGVRGMRVSAFLAIADQAAAKIRPADPREIRKIGRNTVGEEGAATRVTSGNPIRGATNDDINYR